MKFKINGKTHTRIEQPSGTVEYYYRGELHREDNGPAVLTIDKDYYWYKNGQLHREDGPAIEWNNGRRYWYNHGMLHREDGPAMEWDTGRKEYWINDLWYTEEQFKRFQVQNGLGINYENKNKD